MNREHIRAIRIVYESDNNEKIRERRKAYYIASLKKRNAYYTENREKILAKNRVYRLRKKQEINQSISSNKNT